jgi:hypothetical protein
MHWQVRPISPESHFVRDVAASTQAGCSHPTYLPPVPESVAQLATINNLVTSAFRKSAEASAHHLRLPQPLGCNVPDVELQTAKLRMHSTCPTPAP